MNLLLKVLTLVCVANAHNTNDALSSTKSNISAFLKNHQMKMLSFTTVLSVMLTAYLSYNRYLSDDKNERYFKHIVTKAHDKSMAISYHLLQKEKNPIISEDISTNRTNILRKISQFRMTKTITSSFDVEPRDKNARCLNVLQSSCHKDSNDNINRYEYEQNISIKQTQSPDEQNSRKIKNGDAILLIKYKNNTHISYRHNIDAHSLSITVRARAIPILSLDILHKLILAAVEQKKFCSGFMKNEYPLLVIIYPFRTGKVASDENKQATTDISDWLKKQEIVNVPDIKIELRLDIASEAQDIESASQDIL